ncbi:hypothetical protein LX66_3902 [Chitinophaga japonensis]|uniref:Uncharacterized protein n=1 Tax=Chitinophaga japonensis TaxID=104662 RepID=A0A562T117_CHIJA|nr:hypothetical protein LX66_3902 [Chitinophaga japonensis]
MACCFAFISQAAAQRKDLARFKDSVQQASRQYLKEMAFCGCLKGALGTKVLFEDDISGSIYFDLAGYPPDVVMAVDSLSKEVGRAIKPTQIADYGDKKPITFRCFEWYKSSALDSLVKRYDDKVFYPEW